MHFNKASLSDTQSRFATGKPAISAGRYLKVSNSLSVCSSLLTDSFTAFYNLSQVNLNKNICFFSQKYMEQLEDCLDNRCELVVKLQRTTMFLSSHHLLIADFTGATWPVWGWVGDALATNTTHIPDDSSELQHGESDCTKSNGTVGGRLAEQSVFQLNPDEWSRQRMLTALGIAPEFSINHD